jgi:hypothetical protein
MSFHTACCSPTSNSMTYRLRLRIRPSEWLMDHYQTRLARLWHVGSPVIATGSGLISRVHNDLTLSPLSNSSPTAVAFVKASAEPSASPPTSTRTYAETGTRVQRRQFYRMGWSQQTWQHERRRDCRQEGIFGQGCASSHLDPLPALWRGAFALGLFE